MPAFLRRLFKPRTRETTKVTQVSLSSGTIVSTVESVVSPKPDDRVVYYSESDKKILAHDRSRSPTTSAAVNALKFALQRLAGAPVPGIACATGAVLSIFDGIENMAKAEKESRKLTKRIETLSYLVRNTHGVEGSRGIIDRLVEGLHDLAADMDKALRSNKLEAFLNSQDDVSAFETHNNTLGDIISDLTFCLSTATKRDTGQIRKDIEEALKQMHLQMTAVTQNPQENTAGGMEMRMFDNEIEHITGDFDTGNVVNGGAWMAREIRGNKIGFIGGKAFSENKIIAGHRDG